jgi:DNA-binding response OmpR family regulator
VNNYSKGGSAALYYPLYNTQEEPLPLQSVRILIIEDDFTIATNLYEFLTDRGHVVDAAADGITGWRLPVGQPFDAIVLDIGLPGMDGMKLCRRLRSEAHINIPLLMLTGRGTLQDKLKGFEAGADDYLVKPFALEEVEARLLALHRRNSRRVTRKTLVAADLTLDPRTRVIRFAGKEVKLPPICVKLLETMIADPQRLFLRDDLESAVWGDAQETSDCLRSHKRTLRRALVDAGGYDPIKTVHGLGYRLILREASQSTPS